MAMYFEEYIQRLERIIKRITPDYHVYRYGNKIETSDPNGFNYQKMTVSIYTKSLKVICDNASLAYQVVFAYFDDFTSVDYEGKEGFHFNAIYKEDCYNWLDKDYPVISGRYFYILRHFMVQQDVKYSDEKDTNTNVAEYTGTLENENGDLVKVLLIRRSIPNWTTKFSVKILED